MRHGWFRIEAVQYGDRTLGQQMLGLDAALVECAGKRVLDLGCAEGLIAREFARAGAIDVLGIECNAESAEVAHRQCAGTTARIALGNLNTLKLPAGPWHIVLALAILHKLQEPASLVGRIAAVNPELVVVRLPGGSTGQFATKMYGTHCDLNATFEAAGFGLANVVPGPLDELVQYWRPRLNGTAL